MHYNDAQSNRHQGASYNGTPPYRVVTYSPVGAGLPAIDRKAIGTKVPPTTAMGYNGNVIVAM